MANLDIHHTIIKRAAKAKIELSVIPEEDAHQRYRAYSKNHDFVLFGSSGKQVLDEMLVLQQARESFQSFDITIEEDDTVTIKVRGTKIEVRGMRAAAAFAKAKELWQESRNELDIDDEEADAEVEAEIEAEAEHDEKPGSVVSDKYRARYAEAGHPNNCGDWLREVLDNLCKNKAGTDLELFTAICAANGVDATKRKLEKSSDRGRYMMSGRNELSRVVWANNELKMPETVNGGTSYTPPAEWLEDVQARFNYKKTVVVEATKTPLKEG